MAVVNTVFPVITLTTDFGINDNYSGIVKGIIRGLNPAVNIIDITSSVSRFNIAAGMYLIETSYGFFPRGTIHIGVVDPGVGTNRKAILVETADYFFLGPDNGLFSFLKKRQIKRIIGIENPKYLAGEISDTFHARDVFAPVAGYLSLGVAPDEFGGKCNSIQALNRIRNKKTQAGLKGRLIYIDHFGNLVTSFRMDILPSGEQIVYINGNEIGPVKKTFGSVPVGKPVCYFNSFGYLEIALRKSSAAEHFGVDYGDDTDILIAPKK